MSWEMRKEYFQNDPDNLISQKEKVGLNQIFF